MFHIKKYRFGVDIKGIILFLIIMIPNIIWFMIPASIDPLRRESITQSVDTVAQVFQIIMVAALGGIKNLECKKDIKGKAGYAVITCIILYYFGWILYYLGIVNAIIHLDLCIAPCMAFILFACIRKNAVAFLSAIGFTVCHVIYVFVNFI